MAIDRATAVKALRKAKQDPSAFSTDELEMLMSAAEAPAASLGESAPATPFGLGPTGGDKLAEEIKPRGSADDVLAARKANPQIAEAFNLSPKMRTKLSTEERDAIAKKDEAMHFQPGDAEHGRSGSGRRDLFAPPEFLPPQPDPPQGAVGPLDAFTTSIDKARSNLPAYAGGKVVQYTEPPLSQFHREMYPVLGDDVLKMGVGSPQYKEYADEKWKPIYDEAQQSGTPVVRLAYKNAQTIAEKAAKFGGQAIATGAAAAVGADEAAFGGLVSRIAAGGDDAQKANYERLAESSPVARFAGQVAGGASQIGMGGLAGKALGRALPEAVGAIGAGARGAASAAAQGMGTQTSMAASEDRLPGIGELALSGGLAAPFGALGGVHGQNLRRTTPLGQIEKSGLGETEMLRGVRRSPRADEIREASSALGPGREADSLARELEGPMTKAGRDVSAQLRAEIGETQNQYYSMTKDVKRPTTSLVKEAMKLHENLVTDTGPLAYSGSDRRVLQEAITKSSHAEIIPSVGSGPTIRSSNPSAIDLDPEQAMKMGIDVDKKIAAYRATGQALGDHFVVRVTPESLNPEQTEEVIRLLGEHLNQGKNETALKSLMRASREVRDQFPAVGPIAADNSTSIDLGSEVLELKGWSAFQHEAAQRTQAMQRRLEYGGLPKGIADQSAPLDKAQAENFRGTASGYRQPGRSPDADEALREFAELGGQSQKLEELAGQKGLDEMKGHLPTSRKDLLNAGRTRLDPMLRFYGPAGASLLPSAPGVRRQELPEKMDEGMLRMHKKVMGFERF